MDPLSAIDFVVGSITWTFLFVLFWVFLLQREREYIWPAVFKFLCFLAYVGYLAVIGGGDSSYYFEAGTDHARLLQGLFTNGDMQFFTVSPFWSPGGNQTNRMVSLSGLMLFFTGGSYLGTTALCCGLGFVGQVMIHKALLLNIYVPAARKVVTFGCLFLPSLGFWSSGLLKDPLGILGIGVFYYGWSHLQGGRKSLWPILFTALGLYIVFLFRNQIVPCIVASATTAIIFGNKSDDRSPMRRLMVAIVSGLLILFVFRFWFASQAEEGTVEALPVLLAESQKFYTDSGFGQVSEVGAGGTWIAVLVGAPLGIINVLFRPFLWDVRNLTMAIAALENVIILWFMFRIRRALRRIGSGGFTAEEKKHAVYSMTFVATLAMIVGTSTLNLGTTSRYRIPLLPFIFALAALGSSGVPAGVRPQFLGAPTGPGLRPPRNRALGRSGILRLR